jgi:(2Fe-2S) ferredoxin
VDYVASRGFTSSSRRCSVGPVKVYYPQGRGTMYAEHIVMEGDTHTVEHEIVEVVVLETE